MEKLGLELNAHDKAYVLKTYVHRFTGDHKPKWANAPWQDGKPYPVQFKDDSDWLANTTFICKKDGTLDKRSNHCLSHPTWPNNPELRK